MHRLDSGDGTEGLLLMRKPDGANRPVFCTKMQRWITLCMGRKFLL